LNYGMTLLTAMGVSSGSLLRLVKFWLKTPIAVGSVVDATGAPPESGRVDAGENHHGRDG
jgi:hypothetical protein